MLSQLEKLKTLFKEVEHFLPAQRFSELQALFEEKTKSFQVKLLLYGPYNSGKTVLINALAGKELFSSAPLPETQELQPVRFAEYEIIDSPGFGAPDPHAEMLSRKAARWDADLVLFVVSSAGQVESETVSNEIADLLKSGRSVLFVVNEVEKLSDEEREKAKNRLHAFALQVTETTPSARFYGPLFVNAESALRARTSSPIKRKLEEESEILALEQTILEWLSGQDKYATLATITANLLEELKNVRTEAQSQIAKVDPKLQSIANKIDEIQADMEEFVTNEVRLRKQYIIQWVKDILYSESQPDDSAQAFGSEIDSTVSGLITQADGRLARLVGRLCQEFPLGVLESQIRIPEGILGQLVLGTDRQDEMVEGCTGEKPNAVTTSLAELDQKGERMKLTPFFTGVAYALEQTARRGALRALGTGGRFFSKAGRFLPLLGLGIDIALAIHDLYAHEKRKEQVRRQLEKQIEEQQKKAEARRRAILNQVERVSSDILHSVGDRILVVAGRLLNEKKQIVLEKIEVEKKDCKSAKQKVLCLNKMIGKAQELLLAFKGSVEAQVN